MKSVDNKFIFFAFALTIFTISDLFAQAQNPAMTDSSNVYLGEAIGRSQIELSELPEEVTESIKATAYGDMNMIAVYKLSIVPGQETATDSIINASMSKDGSRRPYRMRNDNLSLNETYYQDTYNDIRNEEMESTAQENATDADMTEDEAAQKEMPSNVEVYYEIEVNDEDKADTYVLMFDDSGQLTHTIPEDM
ncbi:hypothetical protein OKW21_003816 [Catalinimonas alkaloidigena]|uniref:hypothetical protein n=1 Tax=Catalinimonas alkaloidigena TaxID=1075417 RepID=UPI002405DD08|nr:hypothetical protein [Catalinimonas alkaloidigena]MDF9798553.1 hypothetical protein [Catalinimonas alkaloidigena]